MKIELIGLTELIDSLDPERAKASIRQVVRRYGAELHRGVMRKAVFRGHYEWKRGVGKVFVKPTGNLRRSITLELASDGMTATVSPTAEYGAYVEMGTRFMAAQPYLEPALNEIEDAFLRDVADAAGGKR